ncbi:BsaA family SipW-dependent biofilm matrix protein [Hespellia stercorisuis]|uniref:Alternate signal-mediated exported protein, CPF_0494 family n=1 Tax=Hespellia stercorisuis DSM 15480 TaxID=1121950 RepID=A0A1M6I9I9_9FIRM|nr:BsaA family SipW-dependent biofilm matrix protein [Hespellia stercorisuis]SHJ31028.1 alternate signal-mediated exported protein, CPF_0494 family [Hespellia stercorisuis DSM 15480]
MKNTVWKNKKNLFLVAFLCLFLIGGVFAYWTQELQVRNEFKTARYDTKVVEDFTPPSNWLPGQEINKDVSIQNKGTIPVFVRGTIHQKWMRRENSYDGDGNPIAPLKGENIPLSFDAGDGSSYASLVTWGKDVAVLSSGRRSDIDLGLPSVDTIMEAKGKWLLVTDQIDGEGNLYFYYIGNVQPGTDTPHLVDAVTMHPAIEPEIKGEKVWYDSSDHKVTQEIKSTTTGYENARYTMTVNADTVQATASAVKAVFGNADNAKGIVEYLAEYESMK